MSVRLDHGEDTLDEVHEINVTPFIDVMLVLLIIFMVAAPLATVDVAVDLPVSTAEPQPRNPKPIFLTLKGDHTLALGETTIADKQVDYGALMELMNTLRATGYLKVALVGLEARENVQGRQ